jgi:hypothetical protein
MVDAEHCEILVVNDWRKWRYDNRLLHVKRSRNVKLHVQLILDTTIAMGMWDDQYRSRTLNIQTSKLIAIDVLKLTCFENEQIVWRHS